MQQKVKIVICDKCDGVGSHHEYDEANDEAYGTVCGECKGWGRVIEVTHVQTFTITDYQNQFGPMNSLIKRYPK